MHLQEVKEGFSHDEDGKEGFCWRKDGAGCLAVQGRRDAAAARCVLSEGRCRLLLKGKECLL